MNVTSLVMPEPIDDLPSQLDKFISENPNIDGIFTINDFMGLDVIKSMERQGKKHLKIIRLLVLMVLESLKIKSIYYQQLFNLLKKWREYLLKLY